MHQSLNTGKKLATLSLAIGSALGVNTALAQGSSESEKLAIEEIVVTAQRRAESAQDVPVALSAFQASDIEKFNIGSFEDITKISPAITFGGSNTKMFSTIYLRGIGTYSLGAGVEPSVSVIVDGIPVVQQGQALSNLNDIERIEVLKGPQGTLFGKNASAGVISVVTKAPTEEFEASFEQSLTSDDESVTKLSVSGPITDTVGYRVNGLLRDYDGHVEDIVTGKKYGDDNAKALRAKLDWDISDKWNLNLISDYSRSKTSTTPLSWRMFNPATAPVFIPGIDVGPENTKTRIDVDSKADNEDYKFSAIVNYQLGEHTITSMSSVSNWKDFSFTDSDFTDFNFAGLFGIPGVVQGLSQAESNEIDQYLQEIRITSPSSDTFEYMAGVFYEKAKTERVFDRFLILDTHWTGLVDSESEAIFGQMKFGLTESTFLTVGARYNWVKLDVNFEDRNAATTFEGDEEDSAFQGKMALQNHLSDDIMLFASYARGYKGPGFDVSSGFNQGRADNPVGKEVSDSFEVGMKGSFMDDRVQLNVVVFDSIFKGFQAQTQKVDIAAGINELNLNNVGELETKGVEIESAILVSKNLRFDLNLAYTDAVINEFKNATCYPIQTVAEGCVNGSQDLSGKDLSNSPEWKYTLSGEYTLPLSQFDGFANFSYTWQDEINFQLTADPKTTQDDYGILNIGVGIEAEDYKVTVFVNNVLDQEYASTISGAYSGLFGSPTTMQVVPRWERYAGIKLKISL